MHNIPMTLPTVPGDRIVRAMNAGGELVIHTELQFDHQLDVDRLRRALRLTFDAEPVLGCHFVDHRKLPWWERCDDEVLESALNIVRDRNELDAFLVAPYRPDLVPAITAALLPDSSGDTLLLRVSHEATDAGGSKEIATLLADIYNRLANDPDWTPVPNLSGSRCHTQITRRFPKSAYPSIFVDHISTGARFFHPAHGFVFTLPKGRSERPKYLQRFLDRDFTARIVNLGRQYNATINDVITAAFVRAIEKLGAGRDDAPIRVASTVDMRRFLPEKQGEAIGNLSTFTHYCFPGNRPGSIDEALFHMARQSTRRKESWIAAPDFLFTFPIVARLPYIHIEKFMRSLFEKNGTPSAPTSFLSNMGPISRKAATFDKPAKRATMLIPPVFAPSFVLGVSGYEGTLNLNCGLFSLGPQEDKANRLLDAMLAEIP